MYTYVSTCHQWVSASVTTDHVLHLLHTTRVTTRMVRGIITHTATAALPTHTTVSMASPMVTTIQSLMASLVEHPQVVQEEHMEVVLEAITTELMVADSN